MSVPIVLLTSQPGFAVDTSLAKSNDTTYFVQNTTTGDVAVSQLQQPLLEAFQILTPICPSGQTVTLSNPPNAGLYSVLFDFGATAGAANIATVANYGLAGAAEGSPNRWIGGAEVSATSFVVGGSPANIIQVYPSPANGQNLILANYTNASLPAGVVTFFQLSAYKGF
jgi:hypothetical protein